MKKKRIAIIGTQGIPAKYGGFETLAENLTRYLATDYEISVYCSLTPKKNRMKSYLGARLKYLPLRANGWQSMIYDVFSIISAYFSSDILLILGFSGVFAFPLKVLTGKKIIFNIGGIEWMKVRGHKILSIVEIRLKKFFEKVCIKFSDVVVVDNEAIKTYVEENYNIKPYLAEYGGDHATAVPLSSLIISKYGLPQEYDVSVSRAQEDMNIHVLLEAYSRYQHRNLVVISNWQISEYGRNLKTEYKGKYPNIFILEAIYNPEELNAIRSNAQIYLHSHALCGTAPSVTEAMFLGLPILCFDVKTNRASTENQSIYFSDASSLIKVISNLDEVKLKKLGNEMRNIALRRYRWIRISNLYNEFIKSVA